MNAHELVIDAGRAAARGRALDGIRDALQASSEHCGGSDGVIPVDASGWEAVLRDASIVPRIFAFVDALLAARALNVNDPDVIGGQLRRALLNAIALQRQLLRALEQASWFIPPAGRERDREVLEQIPAVAPAAKKSSASQRASIEAFGSTSSSMASRGSCTSSRLYRSLVPGGKPCSSFNSSPEAGTLAGLRARRHRD
jgi:hypothetical protein